MNQDQKVGKVLGELESEVMEIIWQSSGSIAVRTVTQSLQKRRQIAYTTVMTIMNRLMDKGLLNRQQDGRVYLYSSAVSKDKFLSRVSHQIVKNLVASFGDIAIANFTKEIEKIPLAKRRKLIRQLKKANGNL